MIKQFSIFFFFSISVIICYSQKNDEFIVTQYDEVNNISSKSITDILQSSSGYLWMASNEGLIRYDGYSFRIFTNALGFSNSIQKMAEDKNKNIWLVLLDGSLAKFNPSNASFTNISINYTSSSTEEKPGGIATIYIDNENNIWLGITRTGLVKVDPSTGNAKIFDVIPANDNFFTPEIKKFYNQVLDIYENEEGMFWLATPDGLYKFNRRTDEMIPMRVRPKHFNDWRDDKLRCIKRIKNKLWLGSWSGGLISYDLVKGQTQIYKFDEKHTQSFTDNIVNAIIAKSDSELYLATADKGLVSFNTNTKKFTFFSNNSKYHNVPSWLWAKIIFDKDQNIWAINERGLMKFQLPEYKFNFHVFPVSYSENHIFYGITDVLDDGDIRYVATQYADGLHVINKKTGKEKIFAVDKMKSEEQYNILNHLIRAKDGTVYITSRDFIYSYDEKNGKFTKPPQPPLYNNINSNVFDELDIDKQGNIWYGSARNGVFEYDPIKKKYTHFFHEATDKNIIPTDFVNVLKVDTLGRVWLASNRGYFSFYDPITQSIQPASVINKIVEGLYNEKVYDIFSDRQGFIWVSTKSGLVKINCTKPIPQFVKKIGVQNGLNSEIVVGLEEDYNGVLWGIEPYIFAVAAIDEKRARVINYGNGDGINHAGEDLLSMHRLADNKMALLAQGGYYEFDPDLPSSQIKVNNLVVSIMAVNSIDKYFDTEIKEKGKMILKPDENSFYFEFAAIDFKRPELYHYAYKLDGFDKDWVYSFSRRSVSYTNIPGGNYIFKVKATQHKGQWESNEIQIPFFIQTPFYRKWWFIVLLLILSVFSLYSFYRNRLKHHRQILGLETKAQALEKEKTQVLYENLKQHLNPHFLFNSLTSLSSLIRINQKMAIEFLDNMSKIYRYILQSKDNELVHLKDEIKFIATFIRLQKMRFDEGLQVNIDIQEQYDYRKIAPVTLQNLIENAIKHNVIDKESPLHIDIFVKDDFLIIKNNLQRKNFVETSNKQGLDNLKSLYKYLSDKPVVIEEKDNYFIVKIPLI